MASVRLRYKTYADAANAIEEHHLEGYEVFADKGSYKFVISKIAEREEAPVEPEPHIISLTPGEYEDLLVEEREKGYKIGSAYTNYGALGSAYGRPYNIFRPQPARMGDNDAVDHPAHYTDGQIEVWDFIADKNLNFLLGNVVKYVCRAGKKDTTTYLEDLLKAQAYLKREMKRVQDNATD